jgi:hypothetical protein
MGPDDDDDYLAAGGDFGSHDLSDDFARDLADETSEQEELEARKREATSAYRAEPSNGGEVIELRSGKRAPAAPAPAPAPAAVRGAGVLTTALREAMRGVRVVSLGVLPEGLRAHGVSAVILVASDGRRRVLR